MKMQWILVAVVLAAVVFGFTYLKLNSGAPDKSKPPPPPPPEVKLYFPKTESHDKSKGSVGVEWEYRVPGHYDFWFENIHDQPINIGFQSKSCKCTKVEVALATSEWTNWQSTLSKSLVNLILRTEGGLDRLVPDVIASSALAVPEPSSHWQPLPDDNPGFEVPPHAAGWVRFNWKNDHAGPQLLLVQLWTHSEEGGPPLTDLSVPINFVLPARLDRRDKEVGTLSADRSQTRPVEYLCWSSTRSSFTIKPAPESDPFLVVGKPISLSDDQCKRLQEQQGLRVLSGYRVPVSVRDRLEDGRQLDLGPFQRQAFLQIDGEEEPLEMRVAGLVQGEVTVFAPEGPDRIQMGNKGYFDAALGDDKEATLETRNLDLSLALDKAPSFLRVALNEPKITSGIKTWRLRVEVPKRAVAGEFPRDDNPEYRDSAIYLKMVDAKNPSDTARRIRIPVSGKASSR